jgi:hypothetical protein
VTSDNFGMPRLLETEYAGGIIYENGSLEMIPQPEGYIQPGAPGGYDYVYQYKDHLGNVRLSYSDLNGNGSINPSTEILRERNYYPFGLLHRGYNNVINGTENNLKQYQKQEFTEDLGLNIYEWKYRISDPAIGRFWQVDPSAQDYYHNGVYNFSENRVVDGYELKGLEYVSIHHYSNGSVSQIGYYKMSDVQINRLGGTTAGLHNSVAYGPCGKCVAHHYYDQNGNVSRTSWEMQQTGGSSDFKYHGLYSGSRSITNDGNARGSNYDFGQQPIDWADGIAKRHDEVYAAVAGENYAGFLVDTRTLQADLDTVERIDELVDSFLNPFQENGASGVDTPFRTSYSTEMDGTLLGQRIVIGALATYKQWKIDNNLGNGDIYSNNREAFAKDHGGTALILDQVGH